MKNTIQKTLLIVAAISTVSIGFVQSANAYITDPTAMGRLQSAKSDLLVRESRLLRDQDELNKQIWDLKKNNDPQFDWVLNELTQKLDLKYQQLQKTRWELKQIDQALL